MVEPFEASRVRKTPKGTAEAVSPSCRDEAQHILLHIQATHIQLQQVTKPVRSKRTQSYLLESQKQNSVSFLATAHSPENRAQTVSHFDLQISSRLVVLYATVLAEAGLKHDSLLKHAIPGVSVGIMQPFALAR
jgi:hypothetical protein